MRFRSVDRRHRRLGRQALPLLLLAGCANVPPSEPWSLVRGSHAMPLREEASMVRTVLVSTEQSPWSATGFIDPFSMFGVVDFEYGLTDDFTFGLSLGEDLKRSAHGTSTYGVPDDGGEAGSVTALYALEGDSVNGGFAAQLDLVLADDGNLEFRPTFNVLSGPYGKGRYSARAGLSWTDDDESEDEVERDFGYVVEAAYWHPIGRAYGAVEVDLTRWDDSTELYLTPSLTTQMREAVQLQLGVPFGLTGDSANWQFLLGFLFRF
jgi:hypothetical protein